MAITSFLVKRGARNYDAKKSRQESQRKHLKRLILNIAIEKRVRQWNCAEKIEKHQIRTCQLTTTHNSQVHLDEIINSIA